jgi:adenylosuccinate lyase
VRSNVQAGLENIPLWGERDISHSSVERVIIPDSTILIDYTLSKFTHVLKNLLVYPENMKKNLQRTGGLWNSQRLLLELVKKGLSRERAYEIVQRNAMKCWEEEGEFRKLVEEDPEIRKYLKKEELKALFDLQYYLRNIDGIFKKVGI